jgi:hypothetical protein
MRHSRATGNLEVGGGGPFAMAGFVLPLALVRTWYKKVTVRLTSPRLRLRAEVPPPRDHSHRFAAPDYLQHLYFRPRQP